MDLALIILKTGETFISQTEQLEYEPKVHLQQPYQVGGKTKVTLTPGLSTQRMITSSYTVTLF
jgi:hypothetical protein